jgi:hypothetical protein
VGLTERTLRFLLDPFVEAGEMVVVHTLDLCHFLPLPDLVQTYCAVLIAKVADDLPFNAILIRPRVFLPEQQLIGDPKTHVQ